MTVRTSNAATKYFLYVFGLPFSAKEFEIGNNFMVGQSEAESSTEISEVIERSCQRLRQRYHFHSKKIIHLDDAVPAFLRQLIPRCYYRIFEESSTDWPRISTVYHVPDQPQFRAAVYTYTVDSTALKMCDIPDFIAR